MFQASKSNPPIFALGAALSGLAFTASRALAAKNPLAIPAGDAIMPRKSCVKKLALLKALKLKTMSLMSYVAVTSLLAPSKFTLSGSMEWPNRYETVAKTF